MTIQSSIDQEQERRFLAVEKRDSSADGQFIYAVRTTGIYCRPSCPSRTANRSNLVFFADGAQARKAGFRPCQRCAPDAVSARSERSAIIERACRQIETELEASDLAALAQASGFSPAYFHRLFKAATGMTPKTYVTACRARRIRAELADGDSSVTTAIYAAGYNSSSRFYEKADKMLGMQPKAFKNGGENTDIHFAVGQCSLGSILVGRSSVGICTITLGDDPEQLVHDLERRFPNARLTGGDEDFEKLVAQVIGFVEAPGIGLDLPLDIRGTAFQQRVWQALQAIPAGETASYAQIAARMGLPKSTRAVAGACAANAIAVAIPCHRVVRSDGSLSGYRWGVERKRELLAREAST
ncbi:bifunctional DNA-binding transcriptional regulator/O6-methylguanine-DNA methyltransferase Ada [Aureimonas fodinaquatilis]|uniref:methylated-DNA--[protein]-cysteine S-methyltransferase n=1 Tax=Aureimonas fodinaquatilis TaxID=2565783 RepID=A0A5B0E2J5_9HYPH|nr:bifunctional DNA-binding transcriptional regulator/O6-methylguanine-DNA methyltransferase Ada [Aureimonas fodinaquatilis]KAA0971649.1 bifunctional DNA-binding transcriptional regulator/O6-methylguanine-DNA methyltransferase Ada [Aureimonas fodinaquatilis]